MREDDVVAGAAQHVLREIEHLLRTGAAVQTPLTVVYETPAPPPEELVQGFPADLQKACFEALQGVSAADSLQALVQQGVRRPQPEVRFRRANGNELPAATLLRPPTTSDYALLLADLQQLQGVRTAIARAIEEESGIAAEQGELDRTVRRNSRNLQRAIAMLCPRSLDQHLRALWYPAGRRRLVFLHAAVAYRKFAAQRAEHEARLQALQALRDRADEMIRAAQEPFQAMRRALERLLAKLPPPVDSRSVGFGTLADEIHGRLTAFEVLLRAARTDNPERVYRELRQMARGVTLEGLAAILRLGANADALAVVNKLDLEAEEMGPHWGGMPRPGAEIDQRIRVLPPLEGDLLRELLQAKDAIGSDVQVVSAQSMAAGVGIVAIDTYLVKRWSDLLSPEYQQDLLATLRSRDTVALAHVPGSKLYVDRVFEALHFAPPAEVRQLLRYSEPGAASAAQKVPASASEES